MNLEPQVLEVPDAVRLLDEQSYFRVEAFGSTASTHDDIFDEILEFGGGGATSAMSANAVRVVEVRGGKGGGGRSNGGFKDEQCFSTAGTDGLGGGGAGGQLHGINKRCKLAGNRGGSGIVVISYEN